MGTGVYNGDMLLISRLAEYITFRGWNEGQIVELDDISCAIHEAIPEQSEPYGNNKDCPALPKSDEWHIGRIIYFINHPDEIKNIEVDNLCNGMYICPIPIIEDGNHRIMAAMWLQDQGIMEKVHCKYGGREDVLDYIVGKSDIAPTD